ncbi:hypothetical protein EMPG_09828 [Blastomyces silverae]|uniref:Uncharacterized protein n=1 Tax=Blastomyces silverae TaxID=2060906 RepID=A0A0H1BP12_9EURO|nr:hypothetical protein EMPG_09828 [Blastomyces silverae]
MNKDDEPNLRSRTKTRTMMLLVARTKLDELFDFFQTACSTKECKEGHMGAKTI